MPGNGQTGYGSRRWSGSIRARTVESLEIAVLYAQQASEQLDVSEATESAWESICECQGLLAMAIKLLRQQAVVLVSGFQDSAQPAETFSTHLERPSKRPQGTIHQGYLDWEVDDAHVGS